MLGLKACAATPGFMYSNDTYKQLFLYEFGVFNVNMVYISMMKHVWSCESELYILCKYLQAGEMAPLVEGLPYKHKDLNLNFQTPCKKLGRAIHTMGEYGSRRDAQNISEAYL